MEASTKVEGGKFVKLRFEEGEATLVGDFFVHPEEAIEDLEDVVTRMYDDPDAVRDAVADFAATNDVDLVGITPEAIAGLVREVTA